MMSKILSRMPIATWVLMLFPLLCPSAADAQKQIDKSSPIVGLFDTKITSLDLSGTAQVPFGPAGQDVTVTVTATRATDHNSSRSNKTSSNSAAPDGGGGDSTDFDGKTFDLSSQIDVKFDISFEDIDPNVDFDPALGTNVIQGVLSQSAILDAPASPFLFDATLPDFGMLSGRGIEWRGHVTVLKIAFGGGNGGGGSGGSIDIVPSGIAFSIDQGTSSFTPQSNGDVLHEADTTMSVNALYEGRAFSINGLTGTMAETGQFSVVSIPEPTSVVILACGAMTLAVRRRS